MKKIQMRRQVIAFILLAEPSVPLCQGNRKQKSFSQDVKQAAVIPSGFKSFGLDAAFE